MDTLSPRMHFMGEQTHKASGFVLHGASSGGAGVLDERAGRPASWMGGAPAPPRTRAPARPPAPTRPHQAALLTAPPRPRARPRSCAKSRRSSRRQPRRSSMRRPTSLTELDAATGNSIRSRRSSIRKHAVEPDVVRLAPSRVAHRRRRVLHPRSRPRALSPASAAGEDEQRWI